jgi:two-component system cell cycle sensor histidine kinase/response regulator CckA
MVINGNCEMLRAKAPLNGSTLAMLDGIRDAGDRAAALTRQLLTFSRRQVVAPQILDLNAVVTETQQMLQRLIGEDISLVTALEPALARVKADAGQIGQVIMNLAVNARDAMPRGGKLTIETVNVELAENSAAQPSAAPGKYVRLTVTDTGTGMLPEVQAHIFEPFFTTKEKGKGTGLGLATVRGIVEGSGGHLSVHSEVGRGSAFQMFFPAFDAPAALPKTAGDNAAGGRCVETIVWVEDDESVRVLIQEFLQKLGYTILTAPSGADAICRVEKHAGPVDLLVTDVVMPEIGGRELAERLTRIRPGLKVLYLSGYTDDDVLRHGISKAEVAFLQKPFTLTVLEKKIRETLEAPVKAVAR